MGTLTLGDCERVYDACARLPQFVRYGVADRDGLISLLNGCFAICIRAEPPALILRWTSHQASSTAQTIALDQLANIDRFLAVMRAQAAALVAPTLQESIAPRSVAP